ncbi:hypothetical protein V6B95_07780 [Thermoanaerobacterium saccharolyticum]|uniref:hypothetical protein n=1 Tax=Thermoanaerobacterium saccharolyticum TaxID=28896 RepID=UPI002FD908E5
MDRQAVYIYKLPYEKSFTGIALDVHMHKGNLRYFDTNRGHEIPGKITEETEKGFIFISEGSMPGEWQFKVLTIEEFKSKYYKLVEGGQTLVAKLKTTEDLHQWYRREFII